MLMKTKTVKLNGQDVPVEDVLEIKTVYVSDQFFTQIRYRLFEPMFHTMEILMPQDKGYKVELAVRRAMNKK